MDVVNRYITINNHINIAPQDSDFELKASPLSLSLDPASNVVIVKNLYVSIDPYQLNRMKSFSASQKTSDFAVAIVPGEVVASTNPEFDKGDIVVGLLNWGEFTVTKAGGMLNKLNPMGFPLSYHVGILGFSGLTAYAGLFEICKPKKGEKVFVSTALGSVGNLVGQFAKLSGCYVVGCAGSKEKVALLKEKLGFDDAFNYREETDLNSTLKRYFPNGIDIYFDNVGGEMQEVAVSNMNINGRIAVCGVISEYLDSEKRAAPSMIEVIYKRIKIQGFLAGDYLNIFGDFLSTTCDRLCTGKIQPLEDISDGVESIPSAFISLYRGQNIGKKIVKIAEE
ncbi:hypothetical protein E1A91_A05G018400v1 [Gossypium mustelinum]|uniref:Enoyl reductase (ER) domain-containing protein n=1 Tax=Gossypium mustelinum TaxID=34275 RepID=A0A5D2Z2A8_GOSMU|nr:hypothetical protein E1A91_A05G018400v1 [Gossypium mustelinum]